MADALGQPSTCACSRPGSQPSLQPRSGPGGLCVAGDRNLRGQGHVWQDRVSWKGSTRGDKIPPKGLGGQRGPVSWDRTHEGSPRQSDLCTAPPPLPAPTLLSCQNLCPRRRKPPFLSTCPRFRGGEGQEAGFAYCTIFRGLRTPLKGIGLSESLGSCVLPNLCSREHPCPYRTRATKCGKHCTLYLPLGDTAVHWPPGRSEKPCTKGTMFPNLLKNPLFQYRGRQPGAQTGGPAWQ